MSPSHIICALVNDKMLKKKVGLFNYVNYYLNIYMSVYVMTINDLDIRVLQSIRYVSNMEGAGGRPQVLHVFPLRHCTLESRDN